MIGAATTLTFEIIEGSPDAEGSGQWEVLIDFDFQVLQVELLALDQLDVEQATYGTAKIRQVDIPAPTTAAALSNDRSLDEFHFRALGRGFARQELVSERQRFGHDLMEPTYDHSDFAEALGGRMQTGKLAQYGFDNSLADREFVHPAKLADRKEPVNCTQCAANSTSGAQNHAVTVQQEGGVLAENGRVMWRQERSDLF